MTDDPSMSRSDPLRVVTFNLENLGADDAERRFRRMVRYMGIGPSRAPDVVAVQELQGDQGIVAGKVPARAVVKRLLNAIVWERGPAYRVFEDPPNHNEDGGPPGANIRNAYLVRADRVWSLDTLVALSAVAGAQDVSAFMGCRKPLLMTLPWAGRSLTLVNVHLTSRRPDAPNADERDSVRLAQCQTLVDIAKRAEGPVLMLGDFNDEPDSPALAPLRQAGLVSLVERVSVSRRFSYEHHGTPLCLDQAWVSPEFANRVVSVDFRRMPEIPCPSDHWPLVMDLRD